MIAIYCPFMFRCQCLETLSSRQMDMQLFIADGCKEALLEEKRRFCFLLDKHCMFSYQIASFHDKVLNRSCCLYLNIFPGCGSQKFIPFYGTSRDPFKSPAWAFYSKPTISGISMHCVTIVPLPLLYCFYWYLLLNRPEIFWQKSWTAGRTSATMPPTCQRVSWRWSRECARPSPSPLCLLLPPQGTVWYGMTD